MERARFVAEYEKGCWSMVDLCAAFRISRKTGYKVLARFQAEGLSGLEDRTRAPVEQPLKTSRAVEDEILEVRSRFPTWEARRSAPGWSDINNAGVGVGLDGGVGLSDIKLDEFEHVMQVNTLGPIRPGRHQEEARKNADGEARAKKVKKHNKG